MHAWFWSIAAGSSILGKYLLGQVVGMQSAHRVSRISQASQDLSEEVAIETVHEAFEQGLNYFDTSPFYGEGLSEIVSAGETLALSIHITLGSSSTVTCMSLCTICMLAGICLNTFSQFSS